jgi:hypothetical protein
MAPYALCLVWALLSSVGTAFHIPGIGVYRVGRVGRVGRGAVPLVLHRHMHRRHRRHRTALHASTPRATTNDATTNADADAPTSDTGAGDPATGTDLSTDTHIEKTALAKTCATLFAISAPLGTSLDNYHGLFGVLSYVLPIYYLYTTYVLRHTSIRIYYSIRHTSIPAYALYCILHTALSTCLQYHLSHLLSTFPPTHLHSPTPTCIIIYIITYTLTLSPTLTYTPHLHTHTHTLTNRYENNGLPLTYQIEIAGHVVLKSALWVPFVFGGAGVVMSIIVVSLTPEYIHIHILHTAYCILHTALSTLCLHSQLHSLHSHLHTYTLTILSQFSYLSGPPGQGVGNARDQEAPPLLQNPLLYLLLQLPVLPLWTT